jgi:hypothetical protein
MKKNFLAIGVALASLLGAANVSANEEVITWSCQESKQFKTSGTTEKVRLTWESKSYDLERQTSLPGSLRYQTAEMKAGKLPHLFAGAEPFVQN